MVNLTGIVEDVSMVGNKYYAEIKYLYKDKKLSVVIQLPNKEIFDGYSKQLQAGKNLVSDIKYEIHEEKDLEK